MVLDRTLPRVAAITMAWNEDLFLPLWLSHYGRQLGHENLFVIDNGSDDGTTQRLYPASRIQYPRTSFDDASRAIFVSDLANTIRPRYDAVVVTDCDEFLVADPEIYGGLRQYVANTDGEALASIGLNLQHVLNIENPLRSDRPVFEQRRHVQFVSPMCKPAITRRDVIYSPGFHNSSLRPTFGALYNFHMRWVDCGYALKRLAMTRNMKWKNESGGNHQRQPDEDTLHHFINVAKMNRLMDLNFKFSEQMERIVRDSAIEHAGRHIIPQDVRDSHLTLLPDRFISNLL